MPTLVTPTGKYKESYFAGLREMIGEQKEDLIKERISQFPQYLKEIETGIFSTGRPRSEFWLIDGDEYIGFTQIRHDPKGEKEDSFSHIYYEIRPSKRGKGYGNEILKFALGKAKELGIQEAIIACNESNVASRKIIEHNGGVLFNKVVFPERVRLMYKIKL